MYEETINTRYQGRRVEEHTSHGSFDLVLELAALLFKHLHQHLQWGQVNRFVNQ